ncbi:MarR family transcriptional regulator [Mycobacterium sp. AZCC_0083]|uniref:MarR family winged helix-turn-helix transcriptional regulator n=1 Tax=Mycobacterium sp. AZCC_0083 TaxID=2735882 RepID=UPI00161AE2C2|nr:MarR family transcriptional regulator [Mycobacterium sp. AZCC_0083]MBB5162209.1 DNA-binding MarR family transcriptional regulator [Mycobacterium sp. AZCC_0083]
MKTKSALIAEIDELVGAVGDKFDADEDGDAERDFIVERCPKRLEHNVRSLPTLSMHLLAVIAEGPVSVVGLAARSGQLKGTVSKHVQRLVDAGLVARTPVPGNRKEIELSPTADGELIVDAHRRLHEEMADGLHDFLLRYSGAELQVLAMVLRDLQAARKVGVRLVVGE